MKHFYQDIDGWFWFENAYHRLVSQLPADTPSTFVEVGSFRGRSLAYLGVEVLNSRKPVTIVAVDLWADRAIFHEFAQNIRPLLVALRERLIVHHEPSLVAATLIEDASCDVVWIDADHSYESCLADIDAWWPKVKLGGYLGGDDFAMEGVARAVLERFAGRGEIGQGTCTDSGEAKPYPWWLVRK